MRISGLSSGIDTEGLIKDLMNAERIPMDRVFRQKVKAEWKRDAYRDINTKLLQLRNKVWDLRLQGSFSTRTVTSSNSALVSATATGAAIDGTYDITVKSLATSGSLVSNEGISSKLEAFFAADDAPEEVEVVFKGANGTETLTFSKTDTMDDIVKKINDNKNLGLNAFYDSKTDALVITTKATGENAAVWIEKVDSEDSTDPTGLDFMRNLFEPSEEEVAEGETTYVRFGDTGQNARLTINGLDTERESNTFDVNGVSITLHEGSEANPKTVRISVQRDVDAVYERIKGFVDLYNEIISELNLKLREPINRSYEPLTDAEREAMDDKDIERWEEAAKSGLLRSDSLISGILSDMRMAIAEAGLDTIGIKSGTWQEYGRLNIDEAKLKEAIKEDPDNVMLKFTSQVDGKNTGLAAKLSGLLDDGMDRIASTAGKASIPYDQSYLGEQIRRYESRLESMEERLARVENRYWNQFIAMERALSDLYAQSDWLYQQLTALQG